MLHTLETKQILKAPINEIWDFMAAPKNLVAITPPYMGFEVLRASNLTKMYAGQIIEYYVKPILGIKIYWVTEISHVEPQKFFVDEQRTGPYAFWHHKHIFTPVQEGIEMVDIVHYQAPFGIFGKIANQLFIKQQLKSIFDYRYKVLDELFNTKNEISAKNENRY